MKYIRDPHYLEPYCPSGIGSNLEGLAVEFYEKSARLSRSLHPVSRNAISKLMSLVQGHYHFLSQDVTIDLSDFEKASKNRFTIKPEKQRMQSMARAYLQSKKVLQEKLQRQQELHVYQAEFVESISSIYVGFLQENHTELSAAHKTSVEPRKSDQEAPQGIAVASEYLPAFLRAFQENYTPSHEDRRHNIADLIYLAASHQRINMIQPFGKDSEGLCQLYTEVCIDGLQLGANNLWSMGRAWHRQKNMFVQKHEMAKQLRLNFNDGSGNLSNRYLLEYCEFFISSAIDELDFMLTHVDLETMQNRLESFTLKLINEGKLRAEGIWLLGDLFLKGKISKVDAMRITQLSDKTLKILTDQLQKLDLLRIEKDGTRVMFILQLPIKTLPYLLPGLLPAESELNLIRS